MLWMLAGVSGFGIVALLELIARCVVVFTTEPNVEPGSLNAAVFFSADGSGGAWANAFLAVALLASLCEAGLLATVVRRGSRPTPLWQPVALGLIGVVLGGVAVWGQVWLTAIESRSSLERLAALSIATSLAGSLHTVTRIVTVIGGLALTTVLATRARPAPAPDAGPYRRDAA